MVFTTMEEEEEEVAKVSFNVALAKDIEKVAGIVAVVDIIKKSEQNARFF